MRRGSTKQQNMNFLISQPMYEIIKSNSHRHYKQGLSVLKTKLDLVTVELAIAVTLCCLEIISVKLERFTTCRPYKKKNDKKKKLLYAEIVPEKWWVSNVHSTSILKLL